MTLALISPDDTGDLTPLLLGPPVVPGLPAPQLFPDETLTLPAFAPPPPDRVPQPTTYGRVKKFFRRGRHRMTWRMRIAAALVGGAR